MRIIFFAFLSIAAFSVKTIAQSNLYHPITVSEEKSLKGGDLYLSVDNKHFFINNEYSQPVVKGYTLPGQTVSPLLKYLTNNETLQLEMGFRAKHFFGHKEGISVAPLFTAQLNFSPTTQFIMGTLRGDLQHRASDLIFQNEYRYTSKPEYGLQDSHTGQPEYNAQLRHTSTPEYGVQLRHNSNRLWMDIWINWENFTVHGDTVPEQFTTGLSMLVPLYSTSSGWKITSAIQTTIVHLGGEISDFKERGRSDMNNLLGVEIEKNSLAFIDKWGVFGHFLHYKELKSDGNNVFPKGTGVDAGFYFQKQNHHFRASWWKGHNYLSLRGNPIYQSVSYENRELTFPDRDLLSAKYAFKKNFSKDFVFSLLLEGYYDLDRETLDYNYGIQLLYIPQFFLKNIKPIS